MPSPFPGMDPYLEQYWGDVHAGLVLYARDQLQGRLPGDLRARVEERVFVDSPADEERSVYPDIRVVERGRGSGMTTTIAPSLAAQPLVLTDDKDEPITETFIEIIDIGSGRRVVTVLEVLSPENKRPGRGKRQYLKKQRELAAAKVSLVEIDLLRAGDWVLSVPEHRIPWARRTAYRIVVRRGRTPMRFEYYSASLTERLPTINVPLREKDADVPLDLQAIVDQVYANGAYENDLDYEYQPDPPLGPEEFAWADKLLRTKGARNGPPTLPARKRKKR